MKKIFLFLIVLFTMSCSQDAVINTGSNGTLSGSYATLLPVGDFLYVVNDNSIFTYDIVDNLDPVLLDEQEVGIEIESLFHFEGSLFVGSAGALFIYTIDEDGIPRRESVTEYFAGDVTQCDPVVSDGNYAYVTLRSSIEISCFFVSREEFVNELRIYDISDIEAPLEISRTPMDFPAGLGITGDFLFVCEGNLGVKLYDVSDRTNPIEIWSDEGFETFDLILKDGILIVVGPEAIRQYDYSDINNIQFLTEIDY